VQSVLGRAEWVSTFGFFLLNCDVVEMENACIASGIWTGGPTMLVITRREGEEVVIGDPSNPIGVVRIAGIRGDRVRIAFDFPREIDVHRREIAQQIVEELETPTLIKLVT
jgi:carbon storage regulator